MKKQDMKRKLLALVTSLALAASLAACGSAAEGQSESVAAEGSAASGEAVTIRVGYFGTAQYQAQLAIAKEKGFFEEAFRDSNVTIEYNFFSGAGPAINEALLAGELDVSQGVGDQPTISGIANGNGCVIVSRIIQNAKGCGILVDYESDIQTVADLEGKRIAVGIGTANQKTLDLILADAGLTEADVELINLPKIDEELAAFQSNEIDAAYTANLAFCRDQAEADQVARVLIDSTSHPNYAYLSIREDFLKEHPDLAEKYVEALYQANEWYKENTEEGNQIIADFLGLDLNDVKLATESSDIDMVFTQEDYDNLSVTYQFMKDNDILPGEIEDLNAIVDDSFIKQAAENK